MTLYFHELRYSKGDTNKLDVYHGEVKEDQRLLSHVVFAEITSSQGHLVF